MNSFKSFSLLFYFTFFALTAQGIESNSQSLLKINTEKSTLKWIGEKITTSQHSGSLDFKSGEMTIKDGLVVSGNFIVDMTSISVEDISGSGKKRLEGHLKSDDFFSVDKHDKALLSIKGSKKTDKGFLVDANLTIKDLTHPIQFNMVSIEGGYNADLVFDRSKYNVRFRSGSFFENLGDKLIIDDIVLSSELRF
jgi:polyisoprenoid-binding protein YceI